MAVRDLKGWIPMRIYWDGTCPMLDWGYLGARRLVEPFFTQTINHCVRHPADLLFRHQTPLVALGELAAANPGLPPKGFIFHMSRCGSTLLAQMLAAQPHNRVLSEAGPIDDVLRAHFREPTLTEGRRAQWLQWLVSALGRPANPMEKHLFIKFDCWHILLLPVIQRAFPGVPWVFLYRDPLEVMASAEKQLGGQMIPGVLQPALFGWAAAEVAKMTLYEYTARVLAKLCEAALAHAQSSEGKLANYRQLPAALWPELVKHWKLELSEAELRRMLETARMDAKNPLLPFEPDGQTKRASVSAELRGLTRDWLEEVYARLESQRKLTGLG